MAAKVTRLGRSTSIAAVRKWPANKYFQGQIAEQTTEPQAQKNNRMPLLRAVEGIWSARENKTCFANSGVVKIFTTTTQHLRRGSTCSRSTSHATPLPYSRSL
jgi:hypothetical protein